MFKFLAELFTPNSLALLDCLKCGKSMHSGRDITRMPNSSGDNFYIECPCGSVGKISISEAAAADAWNDMVKKDAGQYRRAASALDDLKQWSKEGEKARARKKMVVTFKYQDGLMFENAETEEEAQAIAIRLSKTYGSATFTNSSGTQSRFVDGKPAIENDK